MYWAIGKRISEREQQGKERADYGKYIIRNLSKEIEPLYGSGFGVRQLELSRQFYRTYPNANTLCSQLNWSQYKLLIAIPDPEKRESYHRHTTLHREEWHGGASYTACGQQDHTFEQVSAVSPDGGAAPGGGWETETDLPAAVRGSKQGGGIKYEYAKDTIQRFRREVEEGETVPNSQLLAPTHIESVLKVRGAPKAYQLK